MGSNPFAAILTAISDESDRSSLQSLSERYPVLRDSVLAQSDYTRKMNEMKSDLDRLRSWEEWRDANWDPAEKKTVGEKARDQQIAELNQKLLEAQNNRGDGMTFDDITKWGKETGAFVTPDQIKAEKAELVGLVNGITGVTTKSTQLMLEHFKNFQEVMNPDDLFKFASEKGIKDIDQAYKEYAKPKYDELAAREAAAREEKIRADERAKVLAERTSSSAGLPTDDGSGSLGHFQAKMMGVKDKPATSAVPADMELGQGIGSVAARAGDMAEIAAGRS